LLHGRGQISRLGRKSVVISGGKREDVFRSIIFRARIAAYFISG
jgi:hypothetical protein